MTVRTWIDGLKRSGTGLALVALCAWPAVAEPTGQALPGLEAFDTEMVALIQRWGVPGAGLAVANKGRIILVRGYGLADREQKRPVGPATLFRLGSLAKPLTAVAVVRLAEEGRFGLDDPVVPILGDLGPRSASITDPRVHRITIRHLLQHTAGFDRSASGDAVFHPHASAAAARQGTATPATCATVLRDNLERKLDFDPGARYAYSNLGYCMLGRVIERTTGLGYDEYVRRHVLAPSGADGLRLAQTFVMADDEAAYYDYPGAPLVEATPGVGSARMVLAPYGAYAMETMDSFGGWIGAPADYLRFLLAVDGERGPALLTAASRDQMFAPPQGLAVQPSHYGLGFLVRPLKSGFNWWHAGSLAGTKTLAVRTAAGYAWVVTFNTRPKDRNGFARDVDETLWRAAKAVRAWPDGDLFPPMPRTASPG
jgi:CubicO group peptidase (beta-lactamase class C family)